MNQVAVYSIVAIAGVATAAGIYAFTKSKRKAEKQVTIVQTPVYGSTPVKMSLAEAVATRFASSSALQAISGGVA